MTGYYAHWLADALRDAGCSVKEHDGWQTRGHGGFTDLRAVIWHHDASPTGDSPWVCDYMLTQWDKAAAQVWVSRSGEWHLLAAGVAYHAGKVRAGKPGNRQSLGVETDHTTGESWPWAQLSSLRRGTAAILRKLKASPYGGLELHKSVCEPVGRKVDPEGLDLAAERALVASFMAEGGSVSIPDPTLMLTRPYTRGQKVKNVQHALVHAGHRVEEDGVFGPATERALRAFQRAHGLVADGICGPLSWAALRKVVHRR